VSPAEIEQEVASRAAEIRERMAAAAGRAGRDPADVTLVGVCKRQPVERVAAGIRAGVHDLAENYVQEARERRTALEQHFAGEGLPEALRWRLIGHLQRNKAAAAARLFDWIDTLDRESLAAALDKRAAAEQRVLALCVQVNISGEQQKSGVTPEALPELLRRCAPLSHVAVRGLMTVPAAVPDPEQSRPAFAQLRELRDSLRGCEGGEELAQLSMGMSSDFEVAIEEGATLVRVGTALFGAREG
jgi:pyridoxal phosphate enzyme (YggS family)